MIIQNQVYWYQHVLSQNGSCSNVILLNSVPKNERNTIPNNKQMNPHLFKEHI